MRAVKPQAWSRVPESLAEGPQKQKRSHRWCGRVPGTQGEVEVGKGEKRRDLRECWEHLKEVLPSQKPSGLTKLAVKLQVLKQLAGISSIRPTLEKTELKGDVGGLMRIRWMLSQAERRSVETAGNAGSHQRRPLPSQKPPSLTQAGCKAPDFGAAGLCLSQNVSTSEYMAIGCTQQTTGWRRLAAGTQWDIEVDRGGLRQDHRECWEPP